MYPHDRMKLIIVQIVNSDHKNNLMKFEKIHCSNFEYINDKVWLSGPLKLMVIPILIKNGTMKFLKNLNIGLIAKKIFLDKNIKWQ